MRLKGIITIIFCLFFFLLLKINLKEHPYYTKLLEEKTGIIIEGESAIRGRILDRNGKVLVDNTGVLNIIYHKSPNQTVEKELQIASKLSLFLNEYRLTDKMKKNYYLITNNNGDDLITKEEYQALEERKLTIDDINKLKLDRITDDLINYSKEEEKIIYLYSLMNEGYYYQDKYLFKDIDSQMESKILELNLDGVSTKVTSKRIYPYNETLKSIFGSLGSIPKEEEKEYLKLNYTLEDIVGISGLEKTYENTLKGTKAKYLVEDDYTLTKISEEQPGNDLYLNIDIDLQLALESTLKEELVLARKKKQSLYFHDAYSIIGEPLTGNILAISAINLKDNMEFKEITNTMLSSSFAMGSVVKGASSTVGYQNNAIKVGSKMLDSCVKLYYQPAKCSYKRLGYVDDITALKTSSNYFQFITAINTTNNTYHYNMQFNVDKEDFDRYRTTFASYGLGSITNIDLPNEQIGMIGSKISGDLLLNLAIGQYDTYTPLELFQYINTIASHGKRLKISLAKQDNITLLNEVNLKEEYYERILEGFYQVFHGGTATSYVNKNLEASGKTGTSETFYDSDLDGVVDTKTINSTVAFFYPRNTPKYSMIVVAPNITNSDTYTYPFTKNISLKMTNYMTSIGY